VLLGLEIAHVGGNSGKADDTIVSRTWGCVLITITMMTMMTGRNGVKVYLEFVGTVARRSGHTDNYQDYARVAALTV